MIKRLHKFMAPSAQKLYGLLAGAVGIEIMAAVTATTIPGAAAIALAGALVLPGALIMLAMRLKHLPWLEFMLYSTGLSVLFLMLTGLGANILLQAGGDYTPLDAGSYLPVFNRLLAGVWLASAWYNRHRHYRLRLPAIKPGALFAAAFTALPALSALGAVSLNQGGTAAFTMTAFGLIAATTTALVIKQKVLPGWVWPWAIFNMALAILWSVSLRGSYITGHDIQLEYYVFRLTDLGSRWSMANLQDAYNACLSITILPTVIKSLTHFDILAQYKVIYQILFAFFATGIFAIAHRYAKSVIAFLAAFIFITFPTFITDMPMLVRQEVAFGFFIMLMLVLFGDIPGRWRRRALYTAFGLGMVLSHYSTTFVTAGIMLGAFLVMQPRQWGWFRLTAPASRQVRPLSLGVVAVIALGTALWTGLYTHTGNNITTQLTRIQEKLPTLLNPEAGNETSSYTFLKGALPSDQELINQYTKDSRQLAENAITPDNPGYSNAANYPLTAVAAPKQPVTGIGRFLTSLGLPVIEINAAAKTGYALAIQGLVFLGILVAIFRRRRHGLPRDFVALAPVGVAILGFQAVMPVIEYGLFRMLQQDLVFLALPITLAALQLLAWLRIRSLHIRTAIIAGAFSLAFLVLSGFTGHVLGGSGGQLALSNSGFYYDAYYTTKADTALFAWLKKNYQAGYPINSDMFLRMKIMSNTGITTVDSVAPTALTQKSYVILANQNVTDNRVSLYYQGGTLVSYTYPMNFLDDNKDLLYSSRDAKVYR